MSDRLRNLHRYDYLKDGISYVANLFSLALGISILVLIVAGVILAAFVTIELQRVPDLAYLKHYHPVGSVEIYDNRDKFVCAIQLDNKRTVLPFSKIPLSVQQAVLAAEDHHFYEHPGINFKSLVRAAVVNLQARRVVEGGSTVTQQLSKNLFFIDSKRSLDRKIAEAIVALQLERCYSKTEILSMYLNEIYFGNNTNGIQQAALRYFGKNAWQLNLPESAFLAGVIRSPSVYGSPQHRDEGIKRQRQILEAMADCHYISSSQAERAKSVPLVFKSALPAQPQHPFNIYPYYVTYVLDTAKSRYGENFIRRNGLKIYTNLDQVAQQAAERAISSGVRRAPTGITNGALVSLALRDGSIRAIVGGAGDYWNKQWNCATNPHTVGSIFKPFVYLTAFLNDVLGPNSVVDDTPLTVHQIDSADYSPKNYDGKFLGSVTVRQALAQSRNVCAVKVAQMVGMDRVLETARAAGITGEIATNISSALGSSALSPLDIAGAYGTIARCGIAVKPQLLRRVEDMKGHILESFYSEPCRVFPEDKAAELSDILEEVVRTGTGGQAKLGDRPVAGKTGTADKAKDLWFVGYTPDMVTAVWVGNDADTPIPGAHVTGGTVVARLWRDFNREYYLRNPTSPGEFISAKYQLRPTAEKPIEPIASEPTDGVADTSSSDTSAASSNYQPIAHSRNNSSSAKKIPVTPLVLSGSNSEYLRSAGSNQAKRGGVTEYTWSR